MSKSKQTTVVSGGGIGFVGALGILFIALKLCGVINWPWLWVLCPLWIGPAILIGGALILAAVAVVVLLGVGIGWLVYMAIKEYSARTHLAKMRAELASRASKGR